MAKNKKYKILFHLPNPNSIYAGKTIYYGFKHAFEALGHTFKILTPQDDPRELLIKFRPNIFFTSISPIVFKYLDLELLKKARKQGTKVLVNTPFWRSPLSRMRVNETQSLSDNKEWVNLIRSKNFGDIYYNICEQGDARMEGFKKSTGYPVHTILLAADKEIIFPEYSNKFKADISYIGTYLPGKKEILDHQVKPLLNKYDVKIYGQDWTLLSRILGLVQRGGQYFNIPYVKSFLKQPLQLEDERRVYTSSTVSINIHETYQKSFFGDINERTFKIPLAEGFEIVDDVPSLKKYFKEDDEIVIAKNKDDWFEKIDYYIRNPEKRIPIIKKGRKKILKYHTYENRVKQIFKIFEGLA